MTRVEVNAKIILTFTDDYKDEDSLEQALINAETCLNKEALIGIEEGSSQPRFYTRFHFRSFFNRSFIDIDSLP